MDKYKKTVQEIRRSLNEVTPEEWDSLKRDNSDPVNKPLHYNKGAIECIDGIEAMLTEEEFIGYLRGNSLKYRWRFRYKNGMEDLQKAEWYEKRLLNLFPKDLVHNK